MKMFADANLKNKVKETLLPQKYWAKLFRVEEAYFSRVLAREKELDVEVLGSLNLALDIAIESRKNIEALLVSKK